MTAWTFSWDVENRNAYTIFVEVPYKLLGEGGGANIEMDLMNMGCDNWRCLDLLQACVLCLALVLAGSATHKVN